MTYIIEKFNLKIIKSKKQKYFVIYRILYYNSEKVEGSCQYMDQSLKKKYNKQALLFVLFHTIFVFNIAFDFWEIHIS